MSTNKVTPELVEMYARDGIEICPDTGAVLRTDMPRVTELPSAGMTKKQRDAISNVRQVHKDMHAHTRSYGANSNVVAIDYVPRGGGKRRADQNQRRLKALQEVMAADNNLHSQQDCIRYLIAKGLGEITQGTVSRYLKALGAVKTPTGYRLLKSEDIA